MHYRKWLRQQTRAICSISGCNTLVKTQGLCYFHYQQLRSTIPTFSKRYTAIHNRLHRAFGKASEYPCYVCGTSADEWGCIANKTESTIRDGYLVHYSTNLEDYKPLCKSCHMLMDSSKGNTHHKSKLTSAIVIDLRKRHANGERLNYKELAQEYNVHRTTIQAAIKWKTWKHLPRE
jgi:hypothetical protein